MLCGYEFKILVKIKKNCPPISRILYLVLRRVARCPSFIYVRHHWRTLSAYPPSPASSGLFRPKKIKPQRLGLFGISTHKVYPPPTSLRNAVRSYRTFSPLLRWLGAVIFCDTLCLLFDFPKRSPSVRWCGCSMLSGLSSLPKNRYRDRLVGNLRAKIVSNDEYFNDECPIQSISLERAFF